MPTFLWSIADDGTDTIFGLDNSTALTHIPGNITGTLELNDNQLGQTATSIIVGAAPVTLGFDRIGDNLIPGNFGFSGTFDVTGGVVTANNVLLSIDDSDLDLIDLAFNGTLNTTTNVNALTNSGQSAAVSDDIGVTGNTDGPSGATFECFLPGTHILTEQGEVTVENLQIGDNIQTAEGELEPIKWIGKQTVEVDQVENPLRGYPVLIKAGALGNNLPHQDLYISPDHSLFIEGLLINAGALVNDLSIIKTKPTETFTYYHVELENHALLVAEGTAAESYLPQKEERDHYDNYGEYQELYPNGSNLMLWPMDYPRISSCNKVPRFVSQKLMAIAKNIVNQDLKLSA